jgi:hypothetical protein
MIRSATEKSLRKAMTFITPPLGLERALQPLKPLLSILNLEDIRVSVFPEVDVIRFIPSGDQIF